tara:strand:+ start:367 stop:2592 length:2226 start_codon:yes stop_codon:yes gene_type:complete
MKFSSGYYSHTPITDYFNAMDSQVYDESAPIGPPPLSGGSSGEFNAPHLDEEGKPLLGIKDIGMSVPMGISAQNVAGIYSKIRMGTGNIEIQFPGYRSGQRQSQTPEMYGEDQRQAIREMSLANDVKFTTHASFGLMGLMGRDERGNFSLNNATQDLFELKRAIDFQSDLGGGSVVIHSGEFERPMTDMNLDDETGKMNLARDPSGRLMFKQAHTQEVDAKFELLDDRTQQKFETVQKNRLVGHPVWLRAKRDFDGVDQDGKKVRIREGDFINYDEEKILNPYDPLRGRVPEYDEDERMFKVKLKSFEDFRREAEEYNKYYELNNGKKPDYWHKMYAEEAYMRANLDSSEAVARGWSLQFSQDSQKLMSAIKHLEEQKIYYENIEKSMPEDEQWKILRQDQEITSITQGFIPPEVKKPTEMIDRILADTRRRLQYDRSTAAGQEQQAVDTHETKQHIVTPIKMLEKHGIRMYAEAGLHAMKKTKDPTDPVFVAVEHIFPERFGGHIEELKWIIEKSRERMVDMLTTPEIEYGSSLVPTEIDEDKLKGGMKQPNPFYQGMSKKQAEEIAKKHIKATIDTGHINLWRKYYQDDPRISQEDNDKNFNKWVLGQIESIAEADMVGNVHLADNMGYHDDHLAPGQGNSPVREIVSILKKNGYEKAVTVEPGADASTDLSDFHGLMKTWRHFGSSVYDVGGMGASSAPQAWGDIQYSFFGQNKPPYYVFGSYAPSNDWTLWSQVPLE